MTNAKQSFGPAIKSKRNERGLSLGQAAKLTGISKPNLWVMEEGKNLNPTVSTLAALSAAYNVSASTLLRAVMEDRANAHS